MKKLALLLFTLSSSLFTCYAQDRHLIDSLKNELTKFDDHKKELGRNATPLMDSVKVNLLYSLEFEYWGGGSDTAIFMGNQILALSQQIGYKKGIGNAYNILGLIYMQRKDYPAAIDNYHKAIKIRTETGDKKGEAGTYNNLGMMYGNKTDVEKSIECHYKSIELAKEIGDSERMAASYGKIGHDYMNLGKTSEAMKCYLNALKLGEEMKDKNQIASSYGDIGNIYYEQGNYKEALNEYLIQVKFATETGNRYALRGSFFTLGMVYYKMGNDSGAIKYLLGVLKYDENPVNSANIGGTEFALGLVYLDMGKYPEALRFADSALKESQINSSSGHLARNYVLISSIFEKQGKIQNALNLANKGLLLATQMGAKPDMKDAYGLLAIIYSEMHDYKAAYKAKNEYNTIYDSINSNENVKKIAVMEEAHAFEKKQDSIKAEQGKKDIIKAAEIRRKSIVTNSAVVISILTLFIGILLVNRQRLKRKKDKIIFSREKQHIESELANAKTILDEYIQSMEEKNKLLEEFKADIEGLKNSNDKERIEKLEHLNKATILTDEDWNKFKQLFEQLHKDFFKRLKEKLPDLTQAEIRLVCLTKLNTGTKQMAGILGVSFDTIKKSRHRLRKKLGLLEEDTIDDIVNSI